MSLSKEFHYKLTLGRDWLSPIPLTPPNTNQTTAAEGLGRMKQMLCNFSSSLFVVVISPKSMGFPKPGCSQETGQRQWEHIRPQGNAFRHETNVVKCSTNIPVRCIYIVLLPGTKLEKENVNLGKLLLLLRFEYF